VRHTIVVTNFLELQRAVLKESIAHMTALVILPTERTKRTERVQPLERIRVQRSCSVGILMMIVTE
jgi:hypothetical protein